MVIIETPSVSITYCIDTNGILIQWNDIPAMNAFQDAYLQVLHFVGKHNKVKHFCTDLSLVGPLDREQEGWLIAEYYPKVYDIIKDNICAAVVFSEGHFQAIVHNYHASRDSKQPGFIQFNYFTDLHEAWHWLSTVQKKGQDAFMLPYAP